MNSVKRQMKSCFVFCVARMLLLKKIILWRSIVELVSISLCCPIFSAKKVTYYLYLFVLFIGLFRRQQFLHTQDNFSEDLVAMFLSANIPLYKLRQDSVKGFFQNLGHNDPSETTCRKVVNDTAFYVGGRYTVCRRPGCTVQGRS